MVPITQVFIDELGWRSAWVALAGLLLLLLLPMVPLAVRMPEDLGLQPDNGGLRPAAASASQPPPGVAIRLRGHTHTMLLWVLLLGLVFGSFTLEQNELIVAPF